MSHHRGTVSTPTGDSDFCPPCGVRRRVDGKGRFCRHDPACLEGVTHDGACWASGMSRAQVELVEALESGAIWESLA